MAILGRLKLFLEQQIKKVEEEIKKQKYDADELEKIEKLVYSELKQFATDDLEEIVNIVESSAIFSSKKNQIFGLISNIYKIKEFISLLEDNLQNVEISDIDTGLLTTLNIQMRDLVSLKDLYGYVLDPSFEDEDLKNSILIIKEQLLLKAKDSLSTHLSELINLIKNIIQTYSLKNFRKTRTRKTANSELLEKLNLYYSMFNNSGIITDFKNKEDMEMFFDFLRRSTMDKEDVFELIILFSKYNLDHYNRLMSIKDASIRSVVARNSSEVNEQLANLAKSLKDEANVEIEKDDSEKEESYSIDSILASMEPEELQIYNEVKSLIDSIKLKKLDEDFYELFEDDFSLESRKEYYINSDKIDWNIIKVDFEKILEPNILTHKEEVFEIFKYIINLNQEFLDKKRKNDQRIEIIKGLNQEFNQILEKHNKDIKYFDNLPEITKNLCLYIFKLLNEENYSDAEKSAELLNKPLEYFKLIKVLCEIKSLNIMIKEHIKLEEIDQETLDIISENHNELKENYNLVINEVLESEEETLEEQNMISGDFRNLVYFMEDDLATYDEDQKAEVKKVMKLLQSDNWANLLHRNHNNFHHPLFYTNESGNKSFYDDNSPYKPCRLRGLKHSRTGAVLIDICEENKRKIAKRYNIDKVGPLILIIGVITSITDDKTKYSNFIEYVRDNKDRIQEFVQLFGNENTPEEVLFEIIDSGRNKCNFILSDQFSGGGNML